MKKDNRVVRLIVSNVMKKAWTASLFMFFNIFIWKELADLQVLILFNLCYAIVHTFSFLYFSKIVKNWYRREILFTSLLIFSIVFAIVSFLHEYILDYVYLMGSILWIANGMYWVTFNNNYFDLTTYHTRWYYSWLRSSLNAVWKIITPAVMWLIISLDYLGYWYQTTFFIWTIIFALGAFIGNVELPVQKHREYKFKKSAKKILSHKKIFLTYFFSILVAFAFSNILLDTLMPLLMYIKVVEEYKLGFIISLFWILSVILSYFIWKYVSYKYYKHLILITWFGYVITMIFILLFPVYIVLFTAILTLLFVIYVVPVRVVIQNVFHDVKWHNKIVSENTAIQEICVMSWRIWALASIYFLPGLDPINLHILFMVMIVMIAISSIYFASVDITNKPKHKKDIDTAEESEISTKKEAIA